MGHDATSDEYHRWQAACLVQHFHPVEVAEVLDDVAVAYVATAAAVARRQR